MASVTSSDRSVKKWWLHPMDPENVAELSDSDRRNAKAYNHWLLVWIVLFAVVAIGTKPIPGGLAAASPWRVLLAFTPLVAGVLLVRAFVRLFGGTTDPLIRQIHFSALAVGFLFAFLAGVYFAALSSLVGPWDRSGPVMFACLLSGYLGSLVLSYRRHDA